MNTNTICKVVRKYLHKYIKYLCIVDMETPGGYFGHVAISIVSNLKVILVTKVNCYPEGQALINAPRRLQFVKMD